MPRRLGLSRLQQGRFTNARSNAWRSVADATASGWQRFTSTIERFNKSGRDAEGWPSERTATRFNAVLISVWGLFCVNILVHTGHFTYDQAYFYEHAVRVADKLRWPAYGPFVSGITPSPLTPGGMLYVALSVPFLIFRDPRVGVVWLHILAALGAWLFQRSLAMFKVPPAIRLGALALYVLSLAHARAVETFWNGDVFLFTTPAMLFLAATIIHQTRERLWPHIGLGVLSALSLQTHLSGGMAVLACLSIVLVFKPSALRPKGLLAIGLALAACYLPYFLVEAATGYPNSALLRTAVPSGTQYSIAAMLRSLITPMMYTAHIENPSGLVSFSSDDWAVWAALISGWVSLALCALGLFVRQPLKLWSCGIVLALPIYYRLTGRPYADHYVASVVPFVCLIPGAGLGWILSQGSRFRVAGFAYLGLYAAAAFAILLTQLSRPVISPGNPWNGQTVALQLQRTRAALATGKPIPSTPGDDGAFILSVLAKRVLGKELIFAVQKQENCKADVDLSGFGRSHSARKIVIPLGNNSVFRCK